jgi:YVTN family beta-propeller protein
MTKSKCVLPLLLFLVILFWAASAHANYKITANISDQFKVCLLKGQVTDDQGNPVESAGITCICGSAQFYYPTGLGGYYLGNPPPCNNFTLSFTVPGKGTVSYEDISIPENTLFTLDVVFPYGPSLEQAITVLQILGGSHPSFLPPDRNGDSRIGMQDALYVLQAVAELRGTSAPLSVTRKALRTPMFVFMQAVLSRDTDGDGVDDWFQTTFADAYGFLEISGLAEGIYTLTVTSTDSTKAVRVENIQVLGSDVNLRTLRLTPVGSISGTVQLEGASDHSSIHVYVPGTSYDAYTDSAGNFTISGVPEGTYAVRAEKANYGTITMKDIPVLAGQDSVMDPFILPSVVGSVSGTFRLQSAGDFTGILVTLRRDIGTTYLTTTDSYGDYAFYDVPIGNYQLIATMPGYVSQQSAETVATGTNTVSPKLLAINTNMGTLSGTITRNNISVHSGIQVIMAGTGYAAFTDESGAYTLHNVPQGPYTVFVKADGYSAKRFENVQITKSQVTTLNAVLTAQSGVVGSETCGSIVGTVRYSDKTDHSGISIKIEGTAIPLAGTDQNGGFIINNVPSGNYTLLFTQANYKTVVVKGVEIVPWGTAFIRDVVMIPPVGNISGKVSLEGGPPHDNVTVSVDGTSISAQTLDDGSFLLQGVQEGTVNLTAYKAGFETAHKAGIVVMAGQTLILDQTISLVKPPEPPTSVNSTQASGSSVTVSWTASVSSDVVGYDVYYSTRSDLIDQKANSTLVTGTSHEVTGLSKGVLYYFAVKAVDGTGLPSELSQYDTAEIVPGAPIPPAVSEILEGGYPFAYPESICMSRDGLRAYVTNPYNNVVSLIDLPTASVLGTIVVGQHPADVVSNPARNEVYCINRDSATVSVIDSTQTNPSTAVIGSFNTAASPERGLVSPDGQFLFVSCLGGDNITVIDLDAGTKIAQSPISVGSDPSGMTVANNKLYVANTWDNNVSIIDIDPASATRWQKLGYNIPVQNSPSDMAVRSDGAFVYVANSGSDSISVINTSTDTVVATLSVGDYPHRMSVSDGILYITNFTGSNVSMVNVDTNEVLASTVSVGNYPVGIAVGSDGEKIYVVNNGNESVSIRTY